MDISGLSNPVTPILGLRIHRWVPIAVVENDSVSPSQIDSHPARSCAQNERKVLAVIVEPTKEPGSVDTLIAQIMLREKSQKDCLQAVAFYSPLHKALPHFYPCAPILKYFHIYQI